MKLTPAEAAPFFAHPSQRKAAMLDDGPLPDFCEYRASGGVCGAFHPAFWPGVWMGHIGVLPQAWGQVDEAAARIVADFAAEQNAARIVGWVKESNRAMLAMCRRIGFEIDGRLPLDEPVAMLGWRP